jgi:hypothetical protein
MTEMRHYFETGSICCPHLGADGKAVQVQCDVVEDDHLRQAFVFNVFLLEMN